MIITQKKPIEEVMAMVGDAKTVGIVGCGSISRGELVNIIEYGEVWCKVLLPRTTGWVQTRYLTDVQAQEGYVEKEKQLEEPKEAVGELMPGFTTNKSNFHQGYYAHAVKDLAVIYSEPSEKGKWLDEVKEEDLAYAREYLGLSDSEGIITGVIRGGMSSVADLFVAQMQDWLELGASARMNEPGILGNGNWCWRMLPGALTDELAEKIARMTKLYGRLPE